ncbi:MULTISPECIES: hypothetical protein [unclassified Streptomyces]|uniref:hypothetical protein n=1 Tax=unclassified Streptomyces TaxID=2593676 RepID=UPI002E17E141|nr:MULTISPECIES: hypothetical protein [unclassified Streptomyces]
MAWTQTELLVDAGVAIVATAAVACLWTLTLMCVRRVFSRALGQALNAHNVPSARPGELPLVCFLVLASLAAPVTLIWLAWANHLWLSVAAQVALPLCTFAWLRRTG